MQRLKLPTQYISWDNQDVNSNIMDHMLNLLLQFISITSQRTHEFEQLTTLNIYILDLYDTQLLNIIHLP